MGYRFQDFSFPDKSGTTLGRTSFPIGEHHHSRQVSCVLRRRQPHSLSPRFHCVTCGFSGWPFILCLFFHAQRRHLCFDVSPISLNPSSLEADAHLILEHRSTRLDGSVRSEYSQRKIINWIWTLLKVWWAIPQREAKVHRCQWFYCNPSIFRLFFWKYAIVLGRHSQQL